MPIAPGDPLPDLTLTASGGEDIPLPSLGDRKLVIYFYPKDNTPGCTTQGLDFSALYADFQQAGCEILGVSRDSVRSHDNFCAKHGFPFRLLSDPDEALCQAFDVIHEKNMYGRKVLGVVRSTFLFDAGGRLAREWRKVRVKGHAAEVLDAARTL